MNFTNCRYFLRQTFQIKGSSILVNRKTLFEELEFEILFEQLANKKRTEVKTKLFKASNNFSLNKYKKIDKALPIEPQLDNIQFLRNREIISEEEYEALKDRLYGRDNISNIGFGNNN